MTATPQDVTAAVQELADCAVPGIDPRIVAEVLTADPHLAHTAHEWGWHDTEVREGLFVGLWTHLTGGNPHDRLSESERTRQIFEGQQAWLAQSDQEAQ